MTTDKELTIFQVYDGPLQPDNIPKGFTAFTVALDGRQKSNLDWSGPLAMADTMITKGYKIFWDLQLGLFHDLKHPLSSQAQFRCLKLTLEHFEKTIWEKYSRDTAGVCLYRGSSDFNQDFQWGSKESENFNEWQKLSQGTMEKFCQSAALDYIKLLAEQLPNEAEPFALIKLTKEHTLLDEVLLRDAEQTMPLRLALQGSRIPLIHELAWDSGSSPSGFISTSPLAYPPQDLTLAVCIPPDITTNCELAQTIESLLQTLNSQGLTYRLIAEERLITEWDGLDHLIVISKAVTPTGRRMLQGFCAAGGIVIYEGAPLGLPGEIGIDTRC